MKYKASIEKRVQKKSTVFRCKIFCNDVYLKSNKFVTKEEARNWNQDQLNKLNNGGTPLLTINDLVDMIIDGWLGTPKDNANNRSSLSAVKGHLLGSKSITNLHVNDFVEYGKWLHKKRHLSGSTIAGYFSSLSNCFANANALIRNLPPLDNKMILEARRTLASLGLIKNSSPRAKPIEGDKIRAINKALKKDKNIVNHRDFLIRILKVLECTGLRESSVSRLKRTDFNNSNRTLLLRDLKDSKGKNYNVTVQLTREGAAAIDALNLNDKPFSESMAVGWPMIRKYYKNLSDSIGLIDIKLKDYRSTFITALLNDGASIAGVATYTGHRDLLTIQRFYDGNTALRIRTRQIIEKRRVFRSTFSSIKESTLTLVRPIISYINNTGTSP